MTTIVVVKATNPVSVIVELIKDDGRERTVNGQTDLLANEEQSFVVHDTQSLRIVEG